MANWNLNPDWTPLSLINNGQRVELGDGFLAEDQNKIVENLQYLFSKTFDGFVQVGNVTTTTLAPGNSADVVVSGRYEDPDDPSSNLILDFAFSIPRGNPGERGPSVAAGLQIVNIITSAWIYDSTNEVYTLQILPADHHLGETSNILVFPMPISSSNTYEHTYDDYTVNESGVITLTVLYPWEGKLLLAGGIANIDLSGYVQKSQTIANIDLQDNITKGELLAALNVEDGAQVNTVDSVNGKTGTVILDADDISDTNTTNKFIKIIEGSGILTPLNIITALSDVEPVGIYYLKGCFDGLPQDLPVYVECSLLIQSYSAVSEEFTYLQLTYNNAIYVGVPVITGSVVTSISWTKYVSVSAEEKAQIGTNASDIIALQQNKLDKAPYNNVNLIDANGKITTVYIPDFVLGQMLNAGNIISLDGDTATAELTIDGKSKLGVSENTLTLTNTSSGTGGYDNNQSNYYIVNDESAIKSGEMLRDNNLNLLKNQFNYNDAYNYGLTFTKDETGSIVFNGDTSDVRNLATGQRKNIGTVIVPAGKTYTFTTYNELDGFNIPNSEYDSDSTTNPDDNGFWRTNCIKTVGYANGATGSSAIIIFQKGFATFENKTNEAITIQIATWLYPKDYVRVSIDATGVIYECIKDNVGIAYTNTEYWQPHSYTTWAEGINYDIGDYVIDDNKDFYKCLIANLSDSTNGVNTNYWCRIKTAWSGSSIYSSTYFSSYNYHNLKLKPAVYEGKFTRETLPEYQPYLSMFAGLYVEEGDWLVATASGWGKIDNIDAVKSVNGKTGFVKLTIADIPNLREELDDKTDKVSGATNGNFAGLDSNGNLTDSGKKASDFLGVSGTLTIVVADWNNGEAIKTVSSLGNYDLIQFFPATTADKTNATNADMWVSVSGTTITFTAQNTPSADITFNYFINRGTV